MLRQVDKNAVEKAFAYVGTSQPIKKSRLPPPLKPVKPIAASVPKKPLTTNKEITKQLQLVKTKLQLAQKDMNTCRATMRALFDTHYTKFDNDQVMNALRSLNECMNKVNDGGKDGAWTADEAINLLIGDNGETS
jgi:hypothetical protein